MLGSPTHRLILTLGKDVYGLVFTRADSEHLIILTIQ
jgi:hypothetical protein